MTNNIEDVETKTRAESLYQEYLEASHAGFLVATDSLLEVLALTGRTADDFISDRETLANIDARRADCLTLLASRT